MKKRILGEKTVKKRNRTGRLAACLVLCVFMTSMMAGAAEYQYDAMGRLEAVTYENGDTVRYSYDANGNIRVCEYKSADGTGEGPGGVGDDTPGQGGSSGSGNDNPGVGDGSGSGNPSGGDGSLSSGSGIPGVGGNGSGNGSGGSIGGGGNSGGSAAGSGDNNHTGSGGAEGNGDASLTAREPKKGDIYSTANARYQIVSTGKSRTVTLKSFTDKKAKKFSIPASVKIDGRTYTVVKVAPKAFYHKTKLTQITIGKNITQIGSKAFYKCRSLKKVTVKTKKLKSVGKNAFKGISQKAVIKVPRAQYGKYAKLFKNKGQAKRVKIIK